VLVDGLEYLAGVSYRFYEQLRELGHDIAADADEGVGDVGQEEVGV